MVVNLDEMLSAWWFLRPHPAKHEQTLIHHSRIKKPEVKSIRVVHGDEDWGVRKIHGRSCLGGLSRFPNPCVSPGVEASSPLPHLLQEALQPSLPTSLPLQKTRNLTPFPLPLANTEFPPTMAFTMSMNPFNWFIHQVQASTILPLPSMGRMVTQRDCDHYPIQDLSQRLPGGVGFTAVLVHQEGTGYISNILLLPTLCIIISKSQLLNLINLLVTDGS